MQGTPGSSDRQPSRPTVYKSIRMRSRLEADYAGQLDRSGLKWEYEPQCFAGPSGQWLPDFAVDTQYRIELKPAGLLEHHYKDGKIDRLLRQMSITWDSDPSLWLALIYWEYGAGARTEIQCLGLGEPWTVRHRDMPVPMLWIGMGQYARCRPQVSGG